MALFYFLVCCKVIKDNSCFFSALINFSSLSFITGPRVTFTADVSFLTVSPLPLPPITIKGPKVAQPVAFILFRLFKRSHVRRTHILKS